MVYPGINRAVETKSDSLKALLFRSDSDTATLRLLIETGYLDYYNYQYDSAGVYFSKALLLAHYLEDHASEAKINYRFGEMYIETGEYNTALEHYQKALDYYLNKDLKNNLYNVYFGMGLAYKYKGYYGAAQSYYYLSLGILQELNDTATVADVYNNLGTVEKNMGSFPEAMAHFSKALEIYQKNKMPVYEFNVLNNIGLLHEAQGSPDKALEYYERSLQLARENKNKYYLLAPLVNTASLYSAMERYDKAEELLTETIQLAKEINDNNRVAECYLELGNLKLKNNRSDAAESYYLLALQIAGATQNKTTLTNARLSLSKLSFGNKNYVAAIKQANEALIMSKSSGALPAVADSYHLLYKIEHSAGDYKNALTYLLDWISINDSIYSIEKTKAIEELEIKYQVKNKIEENERLKSEKTAMQSLLLQRKKLSFLLSAGILLSMVVVFLMALQVKNRKKLHVQNEGLLRQKMENLNEKIEHQKRELVSKSVFIAEKNSALEKVINQLRDLQDFNRKQNPRPEHISNMINELNFELKHKKHWKEFETHFIAVHPGFYEKLNKKYRGLTVNDRKLSAFLKMRLSTKDISAITGQSLKSIEVARTRLRRKLGMEHEENLYAVIESI